MKETIKNRWVKALKSGKYKQVKGTLKGVRPDGEVGYCCLGVLCDLYIKDRKKNKKGLGCEFIDLDPVNISYRNCTPLWEVDGEDGLLPYVVAEWAGFNTISDNWNTGGYDPDVDTDLSVLNDGAESCKIKARNFSQIASVIEKNWENI